jgi:hypothetical protein
LTNVANLLRRAAGSISGGFFFLRELVNVPSDGIAFAVRHCFVPALQTRVADSELWKQPCIRHRFGTFWRNMIVVQQTPRNATF